MKRNSNFDLSLSKQRDYNMLFFSILLLGKLRNNNIFHCLLDTDIDFVHLKKSCFTHLTSRKEVIVILKLRLFFCIKLEQYYIDYTYQLFKIQFGISLKIMSNTTINQYFSGLQHHHKEISRNRESFLIITNFLISLE